MLYIYGNNNNSLSEALPKFIKDGKNARYVSVDFQAGANAHYVTSTHRENDGDAFEQIDESSAMKIDGISPLQRKVLTH